jgi:hypothetical protein
MAAFAIASQCTVKTLKEVLGRKQVGQTYYRDRAFFWWNAFALSDMAKHWDWFVKRRNAGENMGDLLRILKKKVGKKRWATFSRRLGKDNVRPDQYDAFSAKSTIWTKGGCWHRSSPFTDLLILHKPLPERQLRLPFMRKLGHDNIRLIEKELMHMIDPDEELAPEARTRAIEYVRRRVPELVGPLQGRREWLLSPRHLPWFFGCKVPYKNALWRKKACQRPGNAKTKGGDIRQWVW